MLEWWLSGSWRSFMYSSSVYYWHLFLISSASVRSIPFWSFIEPIFAWNIPLISLIFLKITLVFPILLFSSISLHSSLRKAFLSLLAIPWNSAFKSEQWPHKRLTQTCAWVSRSLQWRHGLVVACCRVGGTQCSSVCMGPFEGGCHYLHYLHLSLAPGKQQERDTAPPINRKLD